jgi:streptomycin 6-kinase
VSSDTPEWVDPGWLRTVPARIDRCATRWRLTVGERLGHGKTSRVFSCTDEHGRDLVLKLAPAEMRPELEAAALTVWDGRGAVRLVDFAPEAGALLLERLVPGTPLPPGDDVGAIERVAHPLMALNAARVPDGHPFPTQLEFLDVWLAWVRKSAEDGTAGLRLLDRAQQTARALCADTTSVVLLHGDLIDKNLLLDAAVYVAVDPIPRVGDACSDAGFYAAYHPPARHIGERARALAARCGLDPERAARWAAVWAVGEATETWRADSDELQAWVQSREATDLLGG